MHQASKVVILVSGLAAASWAQAAPAVAPFSSQRMAQVQVASLSMPELTRVLYGKTKAAGKVADQDDVNRLPRFAVGNRDREGYQTVGVLHPVISYRNHANEPRSLVVIEKLQVDQNGVVNDCHACAPEVDVYVFKPLTQGKWQLVSRSRPESEFSGSYGRMSLDMKEVKSRLQPLGARLSGSLTKTEYSNQGYDGAVWEALHLSEDGYIASYKVADASMDSSGAYGDDSPQTEKYTSTIKVQANGQAYYPIVVSYSGRKTNERTGRVVKVTNQVDTMVFDANKQEYRLKK